MSQCVSERDYQYLAELTKKRELAPERGNEDRIASTMAARLSMVEDRQAAIETKLDKVIELLSGQKRVQAWYSPAEVAELLGKAPFTVREWCRLGRISARKRPTGRGDADEWEISHDELERYRNHGLLPTHPKC